MCASSRLLAYTSGAVLAAAVLGSCAPAPPPGGGALPPGLEALYADTRELRDAIDLARSRGEEPTPDELERYAASRAELAPALAGAPSPPPGEDARALEFMRRTLATELVEEGGGEALPEGRPACEYDPEALVEAGGPEALSRRLYACFGEVAGSLSFEGEPTDRLTLLGRMALAPDASRREALWRALAPVWSSVHPQSGPRSPYRTLVRAGRERLRRRGEALGDAVRAIGVDPAVMEGWLVQVLEAWSRIAPGAPTEPWDFAYAAGEAQRALDSAIPLESLRRVNDRFYRDLGADPVRLGVRYDVEPRAGKGPVAFTTFGRRPRLDGLPGEPWVFASYRIGGLDNLLELLHETGHAVHIAAIRTRPAFADWPDSDILTEALADVAALEVYDPEWQQRYLGASAPLRAGLRARYAGIVMDVAWALFEIRAHREPERDPNQVWTGITARYLGIEPHPEVAWWAVRGQLVEAPGYMMNYAAGAILAADLRARLRELRGPSAAGDPGWYGRMTEGLYRFGLERPSRDVIEGFLGRPVSPRALLDDLARAAG